MNLPSLKDNPIFYLGILITIEQAIGQGSVSLAHVVPAAWAPFVQGWCTLGAFVGTAIMTALAAPGRVPAAPVAKMVAWIPIGILGLMLIALPALAQTRTPKPRPALTGDVVKDVQSALGGGATPGSTNEGPLGSAIEKALAKPLQDLAAFIGADNAGAITLATEIPNLQDTNGKTCWAAASDTAAVFKAHPVPLTFKLMSDLEAHRLLIWSAYNFCHNSACGVVFSDLQNEATALAGGISPPNTYSQICSKIVQLGQQLPPAALPAAAVTTPAAPAASTITPAITTTTPASTAAPVAPGSAAAPTAPTASPANP